MTGGGVMIRKGSDWIEIRLGDSWWILFEKHFDGFYIDKYERDWHSYIHIVLGWITIGRDYD